MVQRFSQALTKHQKRKGGKSGFNLLYVLPFPKAMQTRLFFFLKTACILNNILGNRSESYYIQEMYLLQDTGAMVVGPDQMLCSLEIAQFRDFTVYLPFSLCRVESLQLSFQALDNKHKYLAEVRGSHSVLRLPAFCIGTTHLWQKIVRASHEHFCLNVHFLTIKNSGEIQFLLFLFVCFYIKFQRLGLQKPIQGRKLASCQASYLIYFYFHCSKILKTSLHWFQLYP